MQLRGLEGGNVTIEDEALGAFRAAFAGPLIAPEDSEYEEARRVWNSLIDKRPGLIVRCNGQADVVAAVNFAREHSVLVSIRGGGHNVSGSALCDGGLTIDLSDMRAVRADRRAMTASVQGGARLRDVDRECQVFGLATTTGNVSDTGIAGLTLAGGFGNLRRKYGLGIDNLVSVDIVTADGEVRRAAADENPDLFWAVRGGGGNYGIVTSFEFRLFPLGPEVYFAAQFFDLTDAPAAFRAWRDFMESAPEEISSLAFFWTIPPSDGFPTELHNRRVFLFGALYAGAATEGEAATAPLRAIGKPVLDISGPGPYCAWQSGFDPFFVRGGFHHKIYAYWKSLYIHSLPDVLIDDLVGSAREMPSNQCLMAIWHLGGAMAQVAEDATAFGKRNAPYLLSYDSCWIDPTLNEAAIDWTREKIAAAEPHAAGGLYLNFPGVDENIEEQVVAAYGSNHARLVEVKRHYDPANLFRVNHNIRPGELDA